MEKNKAAGPDGFPIEFYQACWEIIKSDLMKFFDDFYHHRLDLRKINYGVITFIPKGENANIIQKYRPICLLQVLFKIFTKTLTVRSEPYMLKIIHHCQIAFIRGRYITDGVMLLQEILRETKVKKQQGVILKIDFEKVYDKVNWNFLLDCCR
jgi:mRNA deadenylase 3'-5' endonuclease subunit Ccr4